VDETGATPHAVPGGGSEVAGGPGEGISASSVQIAYMHGGQVSHSWHQSLMNMIAYDKSVGLNVIENAPFAVFCSGPNSLVEGRNLAVQHFLDQTDAEWLFFVDTDMGFSPEAMERLLLAADPEERPVVGGLCFALKHVGSDGRGGMRVMPVPTLFMWAKNPKQGMGFANRFRYPPDAMVPVAGTGAAFILMHRSALEAVRDKFGDAWYDFVSYEDGAQVSEDLSFCYRLGIVGKPIYVHTGVQVSHHKSFWLSESDYTMPDHEPMQKMMDGVDGLNHPGSDRWTGGDKKDA
jgi:hypothetical protein